MHVRLMHVCKFDFIRFVSKPTYIPYITSPNLVCMSHVAVAQSSADDSEICYALPVFVDDVVFSHNGPGVDIRVTTVTSHKCRT